MTRSAVAAVAAVVAMTGATFGGLTAPPGARAATSTATRPGPKGIIEHVVVIFQENHSFDETLGAFCEAHKGRCDGYVGTVHMMDGSSAPMKKSPDIVPNVFHDVRATVTAVNGGKMNGWNKVAGCNPPKYPRSCLTYYTPEQVPNLAALAQHHVVSDRTFSMYDSGSYGGHIYVAAASQDSFTGDRPKPAPGIKPGPGWGCEANLEAPWKNPSTNRITMEPTCIPARPGKLDRKQYPFNGPFRASPVKHIPTIFDRLDAAHRTWKIYTSTQVWAVCPTFAECAFGPQRKNMVWPLDLLDDAKSNQLPSYSLLLPSGPSGTSQHNGSSMRVGDNWIGRVLNTLQRSKVWSSTAVFITYDDCGCFYDHVPPGKNPDGSIQGIRLPMVIVSPYAKQAYTDSHPATLASVLKFTEEAFGLEPLSVNDRRAYDYANSFDFAAKPTGLRVTMKQYPVSAATKRYIAAHPRGGPDEDDPT
jgi:phospholipase C